MNKTDEKLNNVFSYVEGYILNYGYPPSVREICRDLSIKSTATCHGYLKRLEEQGLISISGSKKRAIMLTKPKADCISVPLIGSDRRGNSDSCRRKPRRILPAFKRFRILRRNVHAERKRRQHARNRNL